MIQCFADKNFKPTLSRMGEPFLVSSAKIFEPNSKHFRGTHLHTDQVEINFVAEGSGIYTIANQPYHVKKGDIIIINSSVFHNEEPQFNHDYLRYDISIGGLQLPDYCINALIPDSTLPVFKSGNYYDDILSLLKTLHEQMATPSKYNQNACHYLMLAILSLVETIISHAKNPLIADQDGDYKNKVVDTVKDYIHNHYSEDISLNTLSKVVNLSSYRLGHIFKSVTNSSPIQYVVKRRLGEAQTLLIKTDMTITDIASNVGYGNPNYFYVLFTKKVGMSPSQYREHYTKQ
jgi:AraC-like DNA-binding protein